MEKSLIRKPPSIGIKKPPSHRKMAVCRCGGNGLCPPIFTIWCTRSSGFVKHLITYPYISHLLPALGRRQQSRQGEGFPLLLRYFDVRSGVLAHGGVVLAHGAEHIPDDSLLPWEQPEGLAVKFALGVSEALDEVDHPAGLFLIDHPAIPL